jgi:hypothetical protein
LDQLNGHEYWHISWHVLESFLDVESGKDANVVNGGVLDREGKIKI